MNGLVEDGDRPLCPPKMDYLRWQQCGSGTEWSVPIFNKSTYETNRIDPNITLVIVMLRADYASRSTGSEGSVLNLMQRSLARAPTLAEV